MTELEIGGLDVRLFTWDYINSNMYVVTDGASALVIDPVDVEEFWQFVKEKSLRTADVLLTHEHFDHISGLNRLRQTVGSTVYAHEKCSRNIGSTARNFSGAAAILPQVSEKLQGKDLRLEPFICAPADVAFDGTYAFTWKGHGVELTHTPGHSEGSMCVVLDGDKLFSGDTLLGAQTVTRLPGGSRKAFRENTQPWLEKKLETVRWVLPGHGDVRLEPVRQW